MSQNHHKASLSKGLQLEIRRHIKIGFHLLSFSSMDIELPTTVICITLLYNVKLGKSNSSLTIINNVLL